MTKIEWCDETINPLGWGCYGPEGTAAHPKPCSYCYARRVARGPWAAQRGCPDCQAFRPHWHPEMLEKPLGWKKPRHIFVQSMGDLFHPETPTEHIEAVLEVAEHCPQHTFIFLTKCPESYQLFRFPENSLIGATATDQDSWERAILGLAHHSLSVACDLRPSFGRYFISAEPLLGQIKPNAISGLSWLIIGADSNRGAALPDVPWGNDLVEAAEKVGVPVFVKNNWPWPRFAERPYHFDWPQQFPKEVTSG
ncbi:MAG: phage Gp37/Gp68 family protein [Actinobacteria bacterium]|nr:phage Gp37/Gp68 family protein [Actinomycetota bacterium]